MKKYILLLILPGLLLTSCNKWLDVEPETMIADEKIFTDYQGARNAVNGIYRNLTSAELYGQEMSWGFASVIARDYKRESESAYRYVYDWDYEDSGVKGITKNIWGKAYKVIANVNKILLELEDKEDSFYEYGAMEKNMIIGEMKAVRGFLHLDMVRLFAPAPVSGDNGAYVPYYTQYGSESQPALPTSKVLEHVIDDLTDAKDLLSRVDTVEYNRETAWWVGDLSDRDKRFVANATTGGVSEQFFQYRGFRMNMVSVLALLSRAYLWAGNKEQAILHANEVLKYGPNGEAWFEFNPGIDMTDNGSSINKISHKLPDGLLLGFYDKNLVSNYNKRKGDKRMELKRLDRMANDYNDVDDARLGLTKLVKWRYLYSIKWDANDPEDSSLSWENVIIPIIRLSEVYLILAECHWDTNPQLARDYLNELRTAREASREIVSGTKEEFLKDLLWEGRKEGFTDGQVFYMFKRLNHNLLIEREDIAMDGNWVVPIPDEENI